MPDHADTITPDAEAALLLAVAEEFHGLAHSLNAAGHSAIGIHLHAAASALDRTLPQQPAWWSNPFNGQEGRSHLFLRMIDELRPVALVETGTYRGTTTVFMAEHFAGPVFTCELDPRWYLTAQATLARFPQVDVRNQDSRNFLRTIAAETAGDPLLYYLDAHWEEDLPLLGELELILSSGRSAAVMIDDFAVPSDPEYSFDDYGPGKALTLELLAKADHRGASLFFPTLPARDETGARRGCAVIGIGDAARALARLAELQPHDWPTRSGTADQAGPMPHRSPDLTPLQRLVTARALGAEVESLRGERDAALCERDAARGERDAALCERDAARGERDAALCERDAARGDKDAAQGVIDALIASKSWRLTAPLREVGRWLKR